MIPIAAGDKGSAYMKYKVILASGSPRRCEILKNIGMEFSVIKSGADESLVNPDGIPVDIYVQELAMLKSGDVCGQITAAVPALVIGADTVVSLDGKILGKPGDAGEAFDMLKMLSGREHEVYTGFCVTRTTDGLSVCGSEKTKVKFADLTDDEIEKYVETGEPMDKAGAYGIQGKGVMLAEGISGDYFNVVGLPVRSLINLMKKEFDFEF